MSDTAGVKPAGRSRRESAFRALLVLGAAVSIAVGVWAIVGDIHGVLGTAASPGLARMYGATMLALGIGYAIAAAQPHTYRGLLVVLFAAPAITAIVQIANLARGDIPAGRGLAFAIYDFAYCLLYFRTYPRTK